MWPVRTDSSTALVTASRHDVKEHLTRFAQLVGRPTNGRYLCLPNSRHFILALLLRLDLDRVPRVSRRYRPSSGVEMALVRLAILSSRHTGIHLVRANIPASAIEYSHR
jgi:hypothetical protein